eukprot:gnl/MRDRNA2_/MRDRNA2_85045_c0_seq3.p1 gnl/MRDRNA2_/MRDRNA2_85045_c0~~gnl/MRDRNA2_/MRDRNA2_85045_c0_seq3.p1  ORF type:complete len:682 (+),score=162.32 gnl/MRDRNA2_/MRDRNA2_85045_c0_seq3:107-2152(+)
MMQVIPTPMTHHYDLFLEQLSWSVLQAAKQCEVEESALPGKLALAPPPNIEVGDLCFSIYPFIKAFHGKKMNQSEIAQSISARLESELVVAAEASGPYVNITVAKEYFASAIVKDALGLPCKDLGFKKPPQHWLVEFSSPNTNKPQHLGHVRNNLLGDAVTRLLSMLGHKVTKVNLVNDRGIHICKSMLAYKKFGKNEVPGMMGYNKGDHLVGHYYVEFEKHFQTEWLEWLASEAGQQQFQEWQTESKGKQIKSKIEKAMKLVEAELNLQKRDKMLETVPNLYEEFKKAYKDTYFGSKSLIGLECNQLLSAWEAAAESESPDKNETYQLWNLMNSWVLDGFWATYSRMGIEFDHVDYESKTYQLGKSICENAFQAGLMHKTSNGALAISYDKMPALKMNGEKVLLRANGTSVYMTQDLGTAFMRWDMFGAEKMVYVVADEQQVHFKTLFEILTLLRPEMKDQLQHLSYGMVNLTTGRMKSREGTVVDADNLMDEMKKLGHAKTQEKWPELSEEEALERGEKVGLAALKFYILSTPPGNSMLYDPEQSIRFEGNTGPNALYAYARTCGILKKCGTPAKIEGVAFGCLVRLDTVEERDVLKCLASLHADLILAAENLDPSKVCHAVSKLSQAFNKFASSKEKHPIKNCLDATLREARLVLTEAVGQALLKGLTLLGIDVLECM